MIVTCPNCSTRFNLPDNKVPANGIKVKCSKCAHVFKAEHPPATPEEEVESLLEDESPATDTAAGDDFEETFNDVAAGGGVEESFTDDEPAEEPADEDDGGLGDLFGDDEEESDSSESLFGDEEKSGDDLFDDVGGNDADDDDVGSLFDDDESDDAGDSADESGEDDDLGDLFDDSDDDAEEDDATGEDEDEEYSSVSLGLDDVPAEKRSRKPLGCLIVILVLGLVFGAAIYFKAWTLVGIDLGDMLKNVPFVGQMFMEETGGDAETAPGESPADRVRKIELKNVKQYYVANEKVGNVFVVEGKAVNKFSSPKEQIKVEVILYDASGNVLTSQAFLCGNVLSQFQLQVQTEKEITDGLASQVGILSNNTFIRPDASTPFMAVFFQPPVGVKEFLVKVVDVKDPE